MVRMACHAEMQRGEQGKQGEIAGGCTGMLQLENMGREQRGGRRHSHVRK